MNFLRKIFRLPPPTPPKPSRVVKCHFCDKDVKSEIMEGEVAHMLCILAQESIDKAKREKAAADRAQIELFKIAIREVDAERSIWPTISN